MGERALERAAALAHERETGLTVLAVIPPRLWRARRGQYQLGYSPTRYDEEFARRQLARAKEIARLHGVRARARLRSGAVAGVIVDEASKGYSLVVIPDRANPSGAPSIGEVVREQASIEVELVR